MIARLDSYGRYDTIGQVSYRTIEVELENGHIRSRNAEELPPKASGLLTIIEPISGSSLKQESSAGLRRFLSEPDFPLPPSQFNQSMHADFWEQ